MDEASSTLLSTLTSSWEHAHSVATLDSALIISDTKVVARWSQASVKESRTRRFNTLIDLSKRDEQSHVNLGSVVDSQPSTAHRILLNKEKCEGAKGGEQQFLCILDGDSGVQTGCINLSQLDLHGEVYEDNNNFSAPILSPDENTLVYLAESKSVKNNAFYFENKKEDKESTVGMEYMFKEDYGETLVNKRKPVIVVVDLINKEVVVRDNELPEGDVPLQLCLNDEQIFGVALRPLYRKMGLAACTNRDSYIFSMSLKPSSSGQSSFKKWRSSDKIAVRSPRIYNSTLIWLERDLSSFANYPGPHMAAFKLMKVDISQSDPQPQLVVDVSNVDDKKWPGICVSDQLPRRCFFEHNNELFIAFSCFFGAQVTPVAINISNGKLYVSHKDAGTRVLDVAYNTIVGDYSTPAKASCVRTTSTFDFVTHSMNENGSFTDIYVPNGSDLSSVVKYSVLELQKDGETFDAVFVTPNRGNETSTKSPLILFPHGGPHTVAPASFSNKVYFFNLLNYSVLLVNYRGSFGLGESNIASLLGTIGTNDVEDCIQALDECIQSETVDESKVFVFGGSHGGFLAAQLAGQHPERFKGVCARNPVINIASMASITDIPDWTSIETGQPFDLEFEDNFEKFKVMWQHSPIKYVANVKCPVLLLIGKLDLRVPPSQGFEYYYALKSLGKEVELHHYEDNHGLRRNVVDTNVMINTAKFFYKAMNTTQ